MTISTDGTTVWANQLLNAKIVEFSRDLATGALTHTTGNDLQLTNMADNIEYDAASGDVMIGDMGVLEADFTRQNNGGTLSYVLSVSATVTGAIATCPLPSRSRLGLHCSVTCCTDANYWNHDVQMLDL